MLPSLTEQPEKFNDKEYQNLVKNIGGVIIYKDL